MQKNRLKASEHLSKRIWIRIVFKSILTSFPRLQTKNLFLLSLISGTLLIQGGMIFNLVETPPLTAPNFDLVFNEDPKNPENNLLYQYQLETVLLGTFTGIASLGFYLLKVAP